eukprot:s2483_g6.t1
MIDYLCWLPADCRVTHIFKSEHIGSDQFEKAKKMSGDNAGRRKTAVGTAGLQPPLPDRSGHCRTSAATARSQCTLPDFSPECQIAVGTAGLQPQLLGTAGLQPRLPDRSGHCRSLPDISRECQIAVGTAGLQPRLLGTAGLQPPLPDRSGHCGTSAASARSQWALPDISRDCQIAVGTAGLQPRLPDRSGHCLTSTRLPIRTGTAMCGFNPPEGTCRGSLTRIARKEIESAANFPRGLPTSQQEERWKGLAPFARELMNRAKTSAIDM